MINVTYKAVRNMVVSGLTKDQTKKPIKMEIEKTPPCEDCGYSPDSQDLDKCSWGQIRRSNSYCQNYKSKEGEEINWVEKR